MLTHILGYPRIGSNRELKKACEQYWAGKLPIKDLLAVGKNRRLENWQIQKKAGIDLIPANDFSFYDQVLDMSLMVGAIPKRYHQVMVNKSNSELDLYFAMARGYQKEGVDITAMEMTKWFDTNYHFIVPEFLKDQPFKLFSTKIIDDFQEAKQAEFNAKPVIIGPVSYLMLGKEKEGGFSKISLLKNLLPVYVEILHQLKKAGAEYVQFDEPFLALDLTDEEKNAFKQVYSQLKKEFPHLKLILATYFEGLGDHLTLALSLPIHTLHIDLVRCPEQLDGVLEAIPASLTLSLGIIDGRNIWKNDFSNSLRMIKQAITQIGKDRVMIAPSCSLLHSPCDLDLETNEETLSLDVKQWMAFAKQKLDELVTLKELIVHPENVHSLAQLKENQWLIKERKESTLIHNENVKNRVRGIGEQDFIRKNIFAIRKQKQQEELRLPLFPTTTIGSFPQTKEVRTWRAKLKKGEFSLDQYNELIKRETEDVIRWQEEIGLDVLVHGEFERNDMVEYFGEQLAGFAFTKNGWVQSYGSRCVKPPVIFGDVHRPEPMTVKWSVYAQSLTNRLVKGMLTGPVTILQWSFVRDDQPRSQTCLQIALAIRDEVADLEQEGIKVIQIDEPAIREGLPLRKVDWEQYLQWAVGAFRLSSSGVKDETQIHTHMCYSEFNDIIKNIADMAADVITIECSRSQMELLDVFSEFQYPFDIGPGVYDIHSPRVPSKTEMVDLLNKAKAVIPAEQIWVNPDCGLKTRNWEETKKALIEMVEAAKALRELTKENLTLV